jgi:hypothetical protein
LSLAEQETMVVPSGNVEPGGGVQENLSTLDSESEALAVVETTAPLGPVAFTVSDGNFRVGAVRSIFTVTEAEFDKPAPLVALQVSVVPAAGVSVFRVVVVQPFDEAIPDSGSETDHVTVTDPLFQPLPLALGVTVDVITGGVVSFTRKPAVIIPAPCIVAFVDADEELLKVIDSELLLQDKKA